MNPAEVVGYVASGLVLATFAMRTMIPLRLLGIASNVAFITYGYVEGLEPVLILHAILLPLNIYRLAEMIRLVREVEGAGRDPSSLAWLLPFMRPASLAAGAVLFRKGEPADVMYLLTEGRIRLEEFGVEIEAGEIVGEIGVFTSEGARTATAVCTADCRLQHVARERVHELVFQNPRLAFYLVGLIAGRLADDLKIIEQRVSANLAVDRSEV